MNADGTNLTNVTFDPWYNVHPAWSPDGTQIAFVSNRNGWKNLYVMNSDGTNLTPITDFNQSGIIGHATWSPDKAFIAFGVREDSRFRVTSGIYVAHTQKPPVHELHHLKLLTKGDSRNPVWSPDGRHIAFTRYASGGDIGDIYVISVKGGEPIRLTFDYAVDPTWSPNGMKIAYTRIIIEDEKSTGEIYIMNADGSNPTNLTDHPAYDGDPEWSPDGRHIAFLSGRGDDSWAVWVMNANGTNPSLLPYLQNGFRDESRFRVTPAWGKN